MWTYNWTVSTHSAILIKITPVDFWKLWNLLEKVFLYITKWDGLAKTGFRKLCRKFYRIYTKHCTIFTILLSLWNFEQNTRLLIKLFCFSFDFDETWWHCSYPCVLQLHQVSSKSDEKQKSFINSPSFYSEFQRVSRIVKIVHRHSEYSSYPGLR